MSTPLTGGFDLVIEVGSEIVLQILEAMQFPGLPPLTPPVEIGFPNLGFVVNVFSLDIAPAAGASPPGALLSLTATFNNGSTTLSPLQTNLTGLTGTFTIVLEAVMQKSANGSMKFLSFNYSSTTASVSYDPPSVTLIQAALTAVGSSTTVAQVEVTAGQQIASMILLASAFAQPPTSGFLLSSSSTGSLTAPPGTGCPPAPSATPSPPTFLDVEVSAFEGALVYFATLLPGSQGSIAAKTQLSITGPDSLAVSIGANAFQTLLFCPFLPQTLTCLFPGSNVTTAPPPCGSSAVTVSASSGGQTQPLTIESVSETLGDGEISSEIVVQNSGFCYNVTVQIPLTLTNFKISGGTITATQKAGSPQINGGVEFACDFFFSYLGILGVLTTGTLGAVLSVVVPKAVGTSIASINSAAPVSIPAGVGGVTVGGALTPDFVDVNVTPEAFTLIGGATLESIPPVPPQPGIALTQADTLSPLEIGSGTYSINACGSMNFPWIEYSQQVTAILQVVPIGITVGSVKWYVSTTDSPTMIETPVTGPSPLTVTVGCYFPDPVPSGITIQRTVSLNYSISSDGTQLTLQNFGLPNPADDPPNQGCFYLYVTVEVVDEAGNAWSASAWVAFVGDYSSIADIATSPATLCLDKLIGQALKSVAPAGWTEAQLAGVTSVYSHPSNPPDPYALAQAAGMVLALGGVVADKALVLGNIVQAQPLSQIFAAAAGSRQDVVAYTSTTVARES